MWNALGFPLPGVVGSLLSMPCSTIFTLTTSGLRLCHRNGPLF